MQDKKVDEKKEKALGVRRVCPAVCMFILFNYRTDLDLISSDGSVESGYPSVF